MSSTNFKFTAPGWQVAAALLTVYLVWGTTYLALAVGVETLPPLWLNGLRFTAAGALMLAFVVVRARAQRRSPWDGLTPRTLAHAALVGVLMVSLAMSLVTVAEQRGIGSGLAATVVTTVPMWVALWSHLLGEPASRMQWAGMALGMMGALALSFEGDFAAAPGAALLMFAAPLAWSIGSVASRRLALPPPLMAAALEWTLGGALLLVLAWVFEPFAPTQVSARSAWALAYLLLFGTLLAFNAYLWLLQHTPAPVATSYAFANPAVALAVGVLGYGERLTGAVWLALPLVFAALALILYGPQLQAGWQRFVKRQQWGEVERPCV
jgi:drug/metabolite transporter (DMT)-like permease